MDSVINAVSKNVDNFDIRYNIYKEVYDALTNEDWDTVDECLGQDDAFDKVVKEDPFFDDIDWD